MNYVFWTDTGNIFAYSLMADSADPKDHMQPQPIVPAGKIYSYQVGDPFDYKGETLWNKTQKIISKASPYVSKAAQLAKVLAPFLSPVAGGIFSGTLGMTELLKLQDTEPLYDLNQNQFMYKQVLKDL